ncbi:helix-turn-helix domain-containing protein [Streptomyces chattanoogensis]|uniref:helix-turn-helix domain-containing protein n=1 Tax=Streptomyces chattanoogensis TaxID=66876 RepID=UPI0036A22FD5
MTPDTNDQSGRKKPERSDSLRTFGAVYQGFREYRGFTQESLAPEIRYSPDYIGSVEQGRMLPSKTFVDRSEDVLDALGVLRKAAKGLSKKPGLAAWFQAWAGLEENAITLYTYECRLIPGLLQTEAYARALFKSHLPPLTDDEIETRWAARAERQQLLTGRPNTAYSFILEEHAFLRRTGGAGVTRELIDHILKIAEQRNVELQVMPLVREAHSGLHGPMQLLETPENQWFAYCEGQESGDLITASNVVSMLQMRYARMRAQALSLDDSLSLLQRMRGEL